MADPTPIDLGRAAAAHLGQTDWQLEAEPVAEPDPPPVPPPPPRSPIPFPRTAVPPSAAPPAPERILEALLFVGGPPLTADAVAAVIRGFTPDRFREAIDTLNKTYRTQGRPYAIQPQGAGFVLAVKPAYRSLKEKLFGGPREARLSQPALDVLALVAYRQPLTKADLDALRGVDSGATLRQLVRLGLVAVTRRAEEVDVGYGTTPRFLELFGLASLDDLPRLADTNRG